MADARLADRYLLRCANSGVRCCLIPLAGHREGGHAVDAKIVVPDGAPRGQAARVTLHEYIFPFEM